jgi:hypothetical protein
VGTYGKRRVFVMSESSSPHVDVANKLLCMREIACISILVVSFAIEIRTSAHS